MDGDSIFDIFARNLVAQSGVDEEEIVLLDDSGCPADPVFPGLTKEPGTGALLGRFEAFKFSETTVVNFEVNVQFCQDQCNPVRTFYLNERKIWRFYCMDFKIVLQKS